MATEIDYRQVDGILAKYAKDKGTLIPIMQEVQNLYNYLPKAVLEYISQKTEIPLSEIYGVATFYSLFHLNPRGKYIIRCCQGTACHVRGGAGILDALEAQLGIKAGETTADGRFTLETVACLGACGLAPVMQIDEDTHGRMTPAKVPAVLTEYK
ncbi:MAG: NADH-quinone oxidoreductase subunit NuoE [Phascolarctobacterium sp.]|nr:NADH-quinone oxidoreductase subunit NuoE [Candidatus Phascolarctobacterium caballi]